MDTYLYIILGVLILVLVGLFTFEKVFIFKKQQAVLKKLKQLGEITKENKTYFLITDNQKIQLILLPLKNDETLTILSNTHIRIESAGKEKSQLINYNYQDGFYKWLLIIPGINAVKKTTDNKIETYISYLDKLDNFRIIREEEIPLLIKSLT